MPASGIMTASGEKIAWKDINLLSCDLSLFQPADPALLAFIMEQAASREDVDIEEVSASNIEKGVRALLLESTVPYYEPVTRSLAAIMGTMRHSMVNIDRPGFITEIRLPFDDPATGVRLGSAKCDTFHVPSGLLVDLKNIKWYSIKLMLEEGAMGAKKGYVFQMNLFRVLMKDPKNIELVIAKYPWAKPEDLVVKRMQLTCVPPDLNWINKKEALKLVEYPEIIPIEVPVLPDDFVLLEYRTKYLQKQEALQKNWAPLCTQEERWERAPSFYPLKCAQYCPVLDACIAMSEKAGERHPLVAWNQKKKPQKPA